MKENINKIFGKNVRLFRRKKGLTQEELAEKCHCYQHYISEVENGKRSISLQTCFIIAEVLEVSLEELISER